MRVHPAPKRRNIAAGSISDGGQKKLRRLPHIFSKVLELPFPSDADVEVEEGPTELRFIATASAADDDLDLGDVSARAVEIYPGVMKVVIGETEQEMELDRWRFRLPDETRPRMATAECVNGELIVTVPKGVDTEVEGRGQGFGIAQLVLVQ